LSTALTFAHKLHSLLPQVRNVNFKTRLQDTRG
jgi:hypothetical protein